MPKNKIILALGVIIALLPMLGFPASWEKVFQVLVGLSIVGLSVWTTVDKKISLKAKARAREARKRMIEDQRAAEEQKVREQAQEESIPVVASSPEFHTEEDHTLDQNTSI